MMRLGMNTVSKPSSSPATTCNGVCALRYSLAYMSISARISMMMISAIGVLMENSA